MFASLFVLICGALVMGGLFMPWFAYSIPYDIYGGSGTFDMSVSGWNFISHSGGDMGDFFGSLLAMGFSSTAEWLVLAGGILMTVASLASGLTLLLFRGVKSSVVLSGAAALTGAVLAVIGSLKYILSDMDALSTYSSGAEFIGSGVYVALAFAILGALCAFGMFTQARTRLGLVEQPSDTMMPLPSSSGIVREYYEKKAASYNTESAPAATMPPAAAPSPLPPPAAAGPLPPLAPVVDDTAALECFARAGELEKSGGRDKAVEEYTKAIRFNSRYTAAYFQRGMLLSGMGFKPAAAADFRRVIDLADNPELAAAAREQLAKLG